MNEPYIRYYDIYGTTVAMSKIEDGKITFTQGDKSKAVRSYLEYDGVSEDMADFSNVSTDIELTNTINQMASDIRSIKEIVLRMFAKIDNGEKA